MQNPEPQRLRIAIALDNSLVYAQRIQRGFERYAENYPNWEIFNVPLNQVEVSPLPGDSIRLDAVVTWASTESSWVTDLAKTGVKVINCGSDWISDSRIWSIRVDREDLSDQVISHFKELGFEEIRYVAYEIKKRPTQSELCQVLEKVAKRHQVKFERVSLNKESHANEMVRALSKKPDKEIVKILNSLPRPCGIFCESDPLALAVVRSAMALGFAVPKDLGVIGYCDEVCSRFTTPSITTIAGSGDEIGYQAGATIQRLLGEGLEVEKVQTLKSERIIVRESTGGTGRDLYIERVHREIMNRACDDISVTDLLEIAGVTRKTLLVRYEEVYGKSPSLAIREQKIELAKRLLRHSELSISEIGERIGMTTPSNFSNFFQRFVGCRPNEYRKSNRTEGIRIA